MRSISTNIYYVSSINYLLCHFDRLYIMSLRPRGEAPRGEVQATAAQPYYVTSTERLTMSLAEQRQSQTPTFIERSEDNVISTK